MYLKALEIQGFKSFPEKTVLTFDKDITAIVGPNGSGKSNISDAMLWVMGEQRSKALRGGKMEDVIFGGTEKRSAMGFAQVSLVLDNSKGLFDLDAPEVVITRRYYRTGESEYYLNREAVRLRDINELLMDTGLGRDGYSIIGQGRIAEIVSAKSTDRREIFEEAAGISRYRYRKEEAERKLGHTENNLLRINDKISELELQVVPLEKQAETAKKYLILRDEQRELEISTWMETLERLHAQSEMMSSEYEQAKSRLDVAQKELEQLYIVNDSIAEKMRECDLNAENARAQQSAQEAAAAELEAEAAVVRTNIANNAENVERLQQEILEQTGRTEGLRRQVSDQEARSAEIDALLLARSEEITAALNESQENDAQSDQAQAALDALVAKESELSFAITKCSTERSMLQDKRSDLTARGGSLDDEIRAAEAELDKVAASLRDANKTFENAKEKTDELRNIVNGHKLLMGGREQKVRELSEKLNHLTVEKRSAEGRAAMLEEMEKEYEGMGKAVKSVMRAAQHSVLRGIHGPIAGLITVDERYAVAIETALGAAMQNIVVDSQDDGKAAIEMLKRTDGGRATFLPIDTIRPSAPQKLPGGAEGCLGLASDLVRHDARYNAIFSNLLGRTVIAESLTVAVKLSRKAENKLRIVTLDGQMINAGGSMTGGSTAKNVGILSRANELKKLKEKLEALLTDEKSCAAELAEAERVLAGAKYESEIAAAELDEATAALHKAETELNQYRLMHSTIDDAIGDMEDERSGLSGRILETEDRIAETVKEESQLQAQLEAQRAEIAGMTDGRESFERRRAQLSERLSELRTDYVSLETERSGIQRTIASLNELLAALSGDDAQRQESIDALHQRTAELQTQLDAKLAEIELARAGAEGHKARVAEIMALKLELEGKRTRSEKDSQEKNRGILDLQAECARFEQKKLSAEMEENQIIDKLWDSYELSRSAAQALRRPVESMSAATKRIAELKREISRLGSVNVGAIEEFARVSERYDFLKGQRDDVEKAKRDLLKIINSVTDEMQEIFLREFNAINESFRTVFLELFGGGKASLLLEDPENPLECGIEIKVQPPGKAVTTISLLSGGEKSFVAIALYFAIMKVRPTPFCVMDEIDAALDEANVDRYASYMRAMAGQTQFIAITHHRGTMEEADVLYGVTMQEKGVTTVLTVDLEEAEKTIRK